jgi:hypothetical protein
MKSDSASNPTDKKSIKLIKDSKDRYPSTHKNDISRDPFFKKNAIHSIDCPGECLG